MNRNFLITLLFLLSANNILIGADKVDYDELTSIERLQIKERLKIKPKRLTFEEQRAQSARLSTPSPLRRRTRSASPNVSPSSKLPGSPQNKILNRTSSIDSPPRSKSASPNGASSPDSPPVFNRLYPSPPSKGRKGKGRRRGNRTSSPLVETGPTPPDSQSGSPQTSLLKDLQKMVAIFDTTDTTPRLPIIAEVKHTDGAIPNPATVLALVKASQESEKIRLQADASDFHKPNGAFTKTDTYRPSFARTKITNVSAVTEVEVPVEKIIDTPLRASTPPAAVSSSFGLTPQPPARRRAFADPLQPRKRASRPVATIPVATIIEEVEEVEENTPAAPVQSMFAPLTSKADTGIVVSVSGSGPTNYRQLRQQQLELQELEKQQKTKREQAIVDHYSKTFERLAKDKTTSKPRTKDNKRIQFEEDTDRDTIQFYDTTDVTSAIKKYVPQTKSNK